MATSIGAGFADALKTALSALAPWDPAIAITREYSPEIDMATLGTTAQLAIKFASDHAPETTDDKHTRGKRIIQLPLELVLTAKAQRTDTAEVDSLVGLYELIDEKMFTNIQKLTSGSYTAGWASSSYGGPLESEELRTHGLVEIVGNVTYKYER